MFGLALPESLQISNLESTREGGLLPTLTNIVTGIVQVAPTIISKYYELKTAEEQAEIAKTVAAQERARQAAVAAAQQAQLAPGAPATRYPIYGAEVPVTSMLPILGIVAIGALLLIKGRKGTKKGK